jgi:chorismate mutase/prephenate dehydratase
MAKLDDLRKKIDDIDLKILRLLNRRAGVVLKIKQAKQSKKLSMHSPVRERKIIERLSKLNPGPYPNEAIASIYREIISGSLFLQQSLKVAYLGPSATFTHLAAKRQFGSSAEYVPESTIRNVFESVIHDRCMYGVVPVENSTEGIVNYTLDMFIDADLNITSEILLQITHNLMSKTGRKTGVKKIYSHPQASAQCRGWLEENYPGVPVISRITTAAAAKRVAKEPSSAAIASELAAETYNLKLIKKGIEDYKNNYTRFLVIAKDYLQKTGNDKTSILFSVKDRPGALYSILKHFSSHTINLTKIESRPSRKKAWEYIFFVDMEGHITDRKVEKAVEEVRKECLYLKVLGSYPSAE